MKHVRLPSGTILNLANVVMITFNSERPNTVTVAIGPQENDVIDFAGEDAAMLRAWAEKRPLRVPPARGKKL